MSETCPSCKGANTIGGDCVSFNGWRGSRFEPTGSRYVVARTTVNLTEPFFACSDCGFVWSHVPANELQRLLEAIERESSAGEVDLMMFAEEGAEAAAADQTRADDDDEVDEARSL
ncbi:MAG: hypothetical protein GC159_21980 [Phycisphaera sp.]|nr:hypothetical protein [Phycisphaera sp.]